MKVSKLSILLAVASSLFAFIVCIFAFSFLNDKPVEENVDSVAKTVISKKTSDTAIFLFAKNMRDHFGHESERLARAVSTPVFAVCDKNSVSE